MLIPLLASGAFAGNWSLGANFGYVVETPTRGPDRTFASVLGSPNYLIPGVRLGYRGESERSDVFVDLGLRMSFADGRQSTRSQTTLNYQRNLRLGKGGSELYGTLGGGILTLFETRVGPGGTALSASRLVGGAGLGVRQRYAQGHGTFRIEVRYDQYTKAENWDVELIPAASAITGKVGFDLWLK